uniref:Transcription termination factor 1 n=1 Tax=Elaeophora elaphi TaxID=1147741 RepID=A0A0R3RXV5_9BILA
MKNRTSEYNYKGSKNRKKKFQDVKKLEKEHEEISSTDESKKNAVPPGELTNEKRKLELPRTANHPGEFSTKLEAKHKQSLRSISDVFVMKKTATTAKNSAESEQRKQTQKYQHDKRILKKGVQEKSSDFSRRRVENAKGKSDSEVDMTMKSEVRSVKKPAKWSSESNSMDDSTAVNKSKRERENENKRSEKQIAKLAKILQTSDKNKAKQAIVEEEDVNKSGQDLENSSGSGKKDRKKKMKKVSGKKDRDFKVSVKSAKSSEKIEVRNMTQKKKDRSISDKESEGVREPAKTEIKEKNKHKNRERKKFSEDFYEFKKIIDKKKAKKHRNTSKSKIKKSRVKKVKGQRIHQENKDASEDGSEISAKKIKLNREENLKGTEKKKFKISDKHNFMKRVDAILTSESEKSKQIKDRRKMSPRRKCRTKLLEDQESQDTLSDNIKITERFTSTSTTSPALPLTTKTGSTDEEEKEQKRIGMITKEPDEKVDVKPKQYSEKRNEIPEDEGIHRGERKIMHIAWTDQYESKISSKLLRRINLSLTVTLHFSTGEEQNEQNEPHDRSYANGLAEIRTILEIYGTEKEKREAFDKLLDEDLSMNEKEIAENLTKAVSDLPMNSELLQKVIIQVLKKMRYSNLLRKQEYENLRKNLVPQAINESVTIALLAQVLQKQKLKKFTS